MLKVKGMFIFLDLKQSRPVVRADNHVRHC